MRNIVIISSSVRFGRNSHRAALFLKNFIALQGARTEILDLMDYDFPLFHERLRYLDNPGPKVLDFSKKIMEADGVVVVSPVYNASFPAALKNVVDLLYDEWARKPVLVVSVTYGQVPGIATVRELQSLFMKLEARVVTGYYTVIRVDKDFTPEGTPEDREIAEKYAGPPVRELLWMTDKSKEEKG